MSAVMRPRPPWYAAATRRLTLVRVGLPTLVACVLAVLPGPAISAPANAAHDIAALVAQTTTDAGPGRDRGPDGSADGDRGALRADFPGDPR
jgi:hypothetical protein